MIKHLCIKNFTLIDSLDITFGDGFSVITGETGAGKSIILGAVGLLLGQRADSKSIREGCSKCVIEATFSFHDDSMVNVFAENELEYDPEDCIIRRELSATGKSRAFINDSPVQLSLLKEIGDKLMDIHSQHQNLLINNEDFQLNVIDIIANDKKQTEDYSAAYSEYHKAKKRLSEIQKQVDDSQKNEDFIRYQVEELQKADLCEGELEELREEEEMISHSEDIKSSLYFADNTLNGDESSIISSLKQVANQISSIEDVFPQIKDISERMQSAYLELQDMGRDISSMVDDVDFDPQRQEFLNERIYQLSALLKKYHVTTIEELIEQRDDLANQLDLIENSDEELRIAEEEVKEKLAIVTEKAAVLTKERKQAAKKIEQEMQQRLIPLGIPNIRFEVQVEKKEPSADGADNVQFLFSANKNASLQPISQTASGGEIARVMLSLKAMISGAIELPTIIFDEIDTGVSGKIAEAMAEIMAEMGKEGRQVISITHLPQIAAMGQHHYKVYKEDNDLFSETHMIQLTEDKRINEIASMLSGSKITDEAISNAKALLNSKK